MGTRSASTTTEAGEGAPFEPLKSRSGKDMKENKERRSAWIKIRVTPDEKKLIEGKASAQGQTVTDFLRQRALDYRLRQTPLEKERIRQLARIGSNMNQIARWANTYKKRAEAVEVITRLILLERELHEEENEPCT